LLWKSVYGEPTKRDDESWGELDARKALWRAARKVAQPEPRPFQTPAQRWRAERERRSNVVIGLRFVPQLAGDPTFEDCVDLRKEYDGLQTIVKLANIHLTPEKPDYDCSS